MSAVLRTRSAARAAAATGAVRRSAGVCSCPARSVAVGNAALAVDVINAGRHAQNPFRSDHSRYLDPAALRRVRRRWRTGLAWQRNKLSGSVGRYLAENVVLR